MAGIVGTILAFWIQELVLTLFPLDILGISEVGVSGPMLVFALGSRWARSCCSAPVPPSPRLR